MALINCPECNKEVSDKAEICPNCGFGVARYVVRQNKIEKIQEETEKEAYLYVKQKKKEEKEAAEREKRTEEDRKNRIYDEAVNKYKSEFSKDVKEAEELFSTISGWKDSDTYLNKCEDRISELRQREALQEEKCKKRNKKIMIATVITGICLGLIVGSYNYYKKVIVPRNIYESAMRSVQNGDYEEAIEILETIIDYKDAVQQIETALEGIYERDYSNAKEFIAESKYTEALEILKNLENREDISELIAVCEYEQGIALIEAKKYREAIDLLINNDIDNNEEKLKECYMELAYQEIANGAYDSALEYFKLADYKGDKYQEIYYEKGMAAYEKLEYISAITYFKESFDYKDSAEMLDEIGELINGCWYKPKENGEGGSVIAIKTAKQSMLSLEDDSYTYEYVKENPNEFMYYAVYEIRNNEDGTYGAVDKTADNELELYTFEFTGNSLKVISVYYSTWEDAIGIYNKVK